MEVHTYDIDAAIGVHRGQIRLKGKEYKFADRTVEEKIRVEREYSQLLDRVAKQEKEGTETPAEDWHRYKVLGVALAVEGVPEEIAAALTELEFAALRSAFTDYTSKQVGVLVDVKKNGEEPPS